MWCGLRFWGTWVGVCMCFYSDRASCMIHFLCIRTGLGLSWLSWLGTYLSRWFHVRFTGLFWTRLLCNDHSLTNHLNVVLPEKMEVPHYTHAAHGLGREREIARWSINKKITTWETVWTGKMGRLLCGSVMTTTVITRKKALLHSVASLMRTLGFSIKAFRKSTRIQTISRWSWSHDKCHAHSHAKLNPLETTDHNWNYLLHLLDTSSKANIHCTVVDTTVEFILKDSPNKGTSVIKDTYIVSIAYTGVLIDHWIKDSSV